MKTTGVESAIGEMDYEVSENQFGMEVPLSIPAAFSINPEATLDEDALNQELEKKDLGMFDRYTKEIGENGRWYLNFEIIGHEYKRINVKMWPDNLRIYPRENQPDVCELAQITSAIEQAMDCSLEHDPIDREAEA